LIPAFLLLALTFPSTGAVTLPSGTIEIDSEMRLPDGAHDLTITGAGTTLHASKHFQGRALFSCKNCARIAFRSFSIDGNRAALERPAPMAPSDVAFARFYSANGILIESADGVEIDHVSFVNMPNFAVIVNASRHASITRASVGDSGSRNARGLNNTSGGILLEEGCDDFAVTASSFRNIRGNALWTHSRYGSPRNRRGRFIDNRFSEIARDAIQVGHATEVTVAGNIGARIGFPADIVDANPVGIDTAGNVDRSVYERNRFTEIDGKCIDLDGFHDGVVRLNTCVNRGAPEDYPYGNFGISLNNSSIDMRSQNIVIEFNTLEGMKFGGMFVIGSGHQIRGNQMRRLNTAHCNETHARFGCIAIADEPGFLESGIYLARRAEKPDPARANTIEDNLISGWKMKTHCIEAAPGVSLAENKIRRNRCINE